MAGGDQGDTSMSPADNDPAIVIIGSGFAGLCMAIALKRAGYDQFVILEKNDDLGGTWRDNTYPGCACDVPSHMYSFSFELNPGWTRMFAPQHEIWEYMRRCASKYGVDAHIRYGCLVVAGRHGGRRGVHGPCHRVRHRGAARALDP
jgi:cation diffusion facilitator CzcD-associated flavoprotein CzcO